MTLLVLGMCTVENIVVSLPDLLSCRISCQLENGVVRGINAEDGTRCDLRTAKRCLDGACWVSLESAMLSVVRNSM